MLVTFQLQDWQWTVIAKEHPPRGLWEAESVWRTGMRCMRSALSVPAIRGWYSSGMAAVMLDAFEEVDWACAFRLH